MVAARNTGLSKWSLLVAEIAEGFEVPGRQPNFLQLTLQCVGKLNPDGALETIVIHRLSNVSQKLFTQ